MACNQSSQTAPECRVHTAAGEGTCQTCESQQNAQEVVELTKILHSKLLLQRGDDVLKQPLTGGGEHNIINIEQQVGSLIPTAIDEQRSVSLGLGKSQCQQERGESRVPSPRRSNTAFVGRS